MKRARTLHRILALCLLPVLALFAVLALPGALLATATLTTFRAAVNVNWTYEKTVTGQSNTQNIGSFSASLSTVNGTGATGTADLIYTVQLSIAASGNSVINLSATPVTDFFGANVVMARVKVFFVSVLTTTTGSSAQLGGGSAPIINYLAGTTPTIRVNNGGVLLLGDTGGTGYAVTGTTADNFKILNNDGANTLTANVCIVGSSA